VACENLILNTVCYSELSVLKCIPFLREATILVLQIRYKYGQIYGDCSRTTTVFLQGLTRFNNVSTHIRAWFLYGRWKLV